MVEKLFSEEERELLKKIERYNSDELLSWRLPNLIFPLVVIGMSLICYLLFKNEDQITAVGVFNLLLNGSLPMFALNRMSSVGINLFKFDKSKEKKASTNTFNLRIKIDEYSKYLIIGISIFYVYQVIYAPFRLSLWYFLHLLVSTFFIYFALTFSKYAYFLQERLIERIIGDDIRDETIEGKNHLNKKYGD